MTRRNAPERNTPERNTPEPDAREPDAREPDDGPPPASRRRLLALLPASLLALVPGRARANPLAALRWRRRPLVVIAPEGTDARLARQRALIEAARDAFAERDQSLVVVAGDTLSVDGAAWDGAAALRARFGVGTDDFAVILVGKDGGEKARWREPVDPREVFARIDAMPMRRREMSGRR